jgi:hypothetical protein
MANPLLSPVVDELLANFPTARTVPATPRSDNIVAVLLNTDRLYA